MSGALNAVSAGPEVGRAIAEFIDATYIPYWNDKPERTQEEVILVMTQVIKQQKMLILSNELEACTPAMEWFSKAVENDYYTCNVGHWLHWLHFVLNPGKCLDIEYEAYSKTEFYANRTTETAASQLAKFIRSVYPQDPLEIYR